MKMHAMVLVLLATAAGPVMAQPRGVQAADYYRMADVGEVAISPDGRRAAFTVTRVVEEANRRRREVWMAPLADGAPTGSPTRVSDSTADGSQAKWSPDGAILSFVSRDAKGTGTVFRNVSNGTPAYRVDGVRGSPVWSKDSKWMAFTWAIPADSGLKGAKLREGWIAPDARTKTLDAERMDGRVITAMHYKSDGTLALMPHPSAIRHRQLYVVPATGGEPRLLSNAPFAVSEPVWSPDGSTLFYSGDSLWAIPSVRQTRDIYAVARDGGAPRKLTTNPGSEYAPAVSPDGRTLAFLYTKETGADLDVMLVAIGTDGTFQGLPRNVTASWNLSPGAPEWTPDGKAIRFLSGIGGNEHVFEVPAVGGPVRQVTQGDRQLGSVSHSADGRFMAYTATTADVPGEVFVARGDGTKESRISRLNDVWLASVTIVPTERLTWKVADGTEIEGWLVKPIGFQPGRKYPMVLKIHGGPHGAYGQTFFQTFHVLSASGFFVLYSNPRGSSNYGNQFEYATRGNWHVMDSEDFLNGVSAAVAKYPEIDANRLGVSGGSYGGVSTNWLTATSNRFAAAVSSRGIANWYSWWGMSDIPSMTEFEFFGFPWEQPQRYTHLSPLTHVANVTAPTLIIEAEEDWRTPMGEGEQWYMALQKLGVPTELVRYPRSSHGVSRNGEPWLLVDRLERIRSWFDYWLYQHPDKLPARKAYPSGVNAYPNGSNPGGGK
jgi:dipeptidyl aminopeptidase/acylaminoacyl peptidase